MGVEAGLKEKGTKGTLIHSKRPRWRTDVGKINSLG